MRRPLCSASYLYLSRCPAIVPATPAIYSIERREYDSESGETTPLELITHPGEFEDAGERVDYTISGPLNYTPSGQYMCPGMKALKEKLLQFAAGSTFEFLEYFTPRDVTETGQINDFLRKHGYQVRNNSSRRSYISPESHQ
jgi:hypothetical protein